MEGFQYTIKKLEKKCWCKSDDANKNKLESDEAEK